jgi:proteasome lid subunit RPN8/RPN11
MEDVVRVRREVLEQMLSAARAAGPQECCGLLGGRDGVISAAFPASNALASPTAFEVAPAELFRIFRAMRAAGLEHLGIYHSHPAGESEPSLRDVERAFYPGAAYFVVSPAAQAKAAVRAFRIRDGHVSELRIEVLE